jgi:ApaG protein
MKQAMTDSSHYQITVEAVSQFVPDQSKPDDNHYVFAYTITVRNEGAVAAQLLSRHWVIKDANGKVREVTGEGVVGEQPHVEPGEGFQYTSGAVLETSVGTMRGSYRMLADDGREFDAEIPEFTLSIPRTLH